MNQIYKYVAILLLISVQAEASILFVQSDLSDPALGEEAVDILQCVNSQRSEPWEFVDQVREREPSVVFFSEHQELTAKVKTNGKESVVLKNQCQEILKLLGVKSSIQLSDLAPSAEPTGGLSTADLSEDKTFLEKNWGWFAGAAVIVAGVFAYKNLSQDRTPARRTSARSR